MPLCLGIESIRSLNFLFVCVRIRSLPRAAGSWARRSRSVHRAGKLAFRNKSHREGVQSKTRRAHRKPRRAPTDAAADANLRAGFGSQALVLPLQQNRAKAIQARRGSPNKKDADPSMRHRHGADDGPTPGLWDDAAASAPPARAPHYKPGRPGRRRRAASLKDYLPQDPVRWWNYIFVAIPALCFIASFILPQRPLHDLGAGFMTDEHFARRLQINATNATAPPATEAVFFEYTIVSRFTPGITIFANIAFVMFCLKQLLHMATAQIDEFPEHRFVKDKFQSREEGQNWNYDFVIVTSIKDEGHKLVDDLQRKNSMRNIVSALENADLETEQYKSRKFDKVFIKIRASRERLEEEADRLNMKFRLDERNVKQRLLDGQPDPLNPDEYDVYPRKNGWTYKGFQMETAITDTEDQCPYAFAAASYISLLTPSTRLVPMRRGRG